jgi:hypothetical protein
MFEADVESIRRSVRRDAPFVSEAWDHQTERGLGLLSSLEERGNPDSEQPCAMLADELERPILRTLLR